MKLVKQQLDICLLLAAYITSTLSLLTSELSLTDNQLSCIRQNHFSIPDTTDQLKQCSPIEEFDLKLVRRKSPEVRTVDRMYSDHKQTNERSSEPNIDSSRFLNVRADRTRRVSQQGQLVRKASNIPERNRRSIDESVANIDRRTLTSRRQSERDLRVRTRDSEDSRRVRNSETQTNERSHLENQLDGRRLQHREVDRVDGSREERKLSRQLTTKAREINEQRLNREATFRRMFDRDSEQNNQENRFSARSDSESRDNSRTLNNISRDKQESEVRFRASDTTGRNRLSERENREKRLKTARAIRKNPEEMLQVVRRNRRINKSDARENELNLDRRDRGILTHRNRDNALEHDGNRERMNEREVEHFDRVRNQESTIARRIQERGVDREREYSPKRSNSESRERENIEYSRVRNAQIRREYIRSKSEERDNRERRENLQRNSERSRKDIRELGLERVDRENRREPNVELRRDSERVKSVRESINDRSLDGTERISNRKTRVNRKLTNMLPSRRVTNSPKERFTSTPRSRDLSHDTRERTFKRSSDDISRISVRRSRTNSAPQSSPRISERREENLASPSTRRSRSSEVNRNIQKRTFERSSDDISQVSVRRSRTNSAPQSSPRISETREERLASPSTRRSRSAEVDRNMQERKLERSSDDISRMSVHRDRSSRISERREEHLVSPSTRRSRSAEVNRNIRERTFARSSDDISRISVRRSRVNSAQQSSPRVSQRQKDRLAAPSTRHSRSAEVDRNMQERTLERSSDDLNRISVRSDGTPRISERREDRLASSSTRRSVEDSDMQEQTIERFSDDISRISVRRSRTNSAPQSSSRISERREERLASPSTQERTFERPSDDISRISVRRSRANSAQQSSPRISERPEGRLASPSTRRSRSIEDSDKQERTFERSSDDISRVSVRRSRANSAPQSSPRNSESREERVVSPSSRHSRSAEVDRNMEESTLERTSNDISRISVRSDRTPRISERREERLASPSTPRSRSAEGDRNMQERTLERSSKDISRISVRSDKTPRISKRREERLASPSTRRSRSGEEDRNMQERKLERSSDDISRISVRRDRNEQSSSHTSESREERFAPPSIRRSRSAEVNRNIQERTLERTSDRTNLNRQPELPLRIIESRENIRALSRNSDRERVQGEQRNRQINRSDVRDNELNSERRVRDILALQNRENVRNRDVREERRTFDNVERSLSRRQEASRNKHETDMRLTRNNENEESITVAKRDFSIREVRNRVFSNEQRVNRNVEERQRSAPEIQRRNIRLTRNSNPVIRDEDTDRRISRDVVFSPSRQDTSRSEYNRKMTMARRVRDTPAIQSRVFDEKSRDERDISQTVLRKARVERDSRSYRTTNSMRDRGAELLEKRVFNDSERRKETSFRKSENVASPELSVVPTKTNGKDNETTVITILHLLKDIVILSCLVLPLSNYFEKKTEDKEYKFYNKENLSGKQNDIPAVKQGKWSNNLVQRFWKPTTTTNTVY